MNNRQLALEWWRTLDRDTKIARIENFRNSSDFRINWTFEMIDKSDGTIEAVYLYNK